MSGESMSERPAAGGKRGRRFRRAAAITVAGAGLVLLLALLLLLLPPVRGRILREGLARADRALPGRLEIREEAWPSLGSLRLGGIVWTSDRDTILTAERVDLSIGIGGLLRRDLVVDLLRVENLEADVPAIAALFPDSAAEPAKGEGEKELPWFRAGSWKGVPSAALREGTVTAPRLLLSEGRTIRDLRIEAEIDLLAGGEGPGILVHRLAGRDEGGGWSVDAEGIEIDLDQGAWSGSAEGFFAPVGPFGAELSSPGADSLRVDVDLLSIDDEGGIPEVRVAAGLLREGKGIAGIRGAVRLRLPAVPELRTLPLLARKLDALPDLEGTDMDVTGSFLLSTGEWEGSLGIVPNDWVEEISIAARGRGGTLEVDRFHVRLPGLAASGSAALREGRIDGGGTVEIAGLEWLDRFDRPVEGIDSLSARLGILLSGTTEAPEADLRLEGGMNRGGLRVRTVEATARLSADRKRPVPFEIRGRVKEVDLSIGGEVLPGDTIALSLRPVLLRDAAARERVPAPAGPTALVVYAPSGGRLTVRDLRIEGDGGRLLLNGSLAAGGESAFDLSWSAPVLPRLLLRTKTLTPDGTDRLRSRWGADGPFRLHLKGETARSGKETRVSWTADFRLPGPSTIAPLLPPGSKVDGLGPVEGGSEGIVTLRPGTPDVRARLEITPNDWITECLVVLGSEEGTVALDTAALVLADGAGLRGSGRFSEENWKAEAVLRIDDLRLLDRFRPGMEGTMDAALRAEAALSGNRAAPRLDVTWSGRFLAPFFGAERMEGRLEGDRRGWLAEMKAAGGGHAGPLLFEEIDLSLRPAGDSSLALFPLRSRLRLSGAEYEVTQSSVVESGDHRSLSVDSLTVRLNGGEMANTRPFEFHAGPERGVFGVRSLELTGGLGTITAEGEIGPEVTDLLVEAELSLPERPEGIRTPDGLWPRRVHCVIHAPDGDLLVVDAEVEGIVWGGDPVTLDVEFEGGAGEGRAVLILSKEGRERLHLDGKAPMDAGLSPFRFGLRGGALTAEARFVDFPLPLPRREGEETIRSLIVNGRASLGGTAEAPAAAAELTIDAPLRPDEAPVTGEIRATLGGEDSPGRIGGTVAFRSADSPWFDGDFSWPAAFSLRPARFVLSGGEEGRIHIRSDGLPLGEVGPYLPSEIGLEGRLRFDLSAAGNAGAPALGGELEGKSVKVTLPDGSWVAAGARVGLSGTTERPALDGQFVVPSGVLRIPDKTRTLLDGEGDAILWELAREETDTSGVEGGNGGKAPVDPKSHRPLDLDVGISIPSGVWIRGQGLEAELAGDLRLAQKGAYPTITGELNAVSGRFLFLGHTFVVERGRAVFYGDDEANPSLDLLLAANVQGTVVRVRFQGTAKEPELSLESDPEMPEGDILSFLVFGRPVDELDNDQMGLLQRRATEVATTFGMAEIESRLARQLGVDMVTIRRARNGGKGNALLIGKYITRKVLLKYEQALENRESFYVNLEYFLSRHLKVETLFGHQNQSGADLTWSADY